MSDAIQVWWAKWYEEEGWPAEVTGSDGATPAQLRKVRLKKYYQTLAADPVGLPDEETAEFEKLRVRISNGLGGGAAADDRLEIVAADIEELRQGLAQAKVEVEAAKILADQFLDGLADETDPDGANPEELTGLKDRRNAVHAAFGSDGKYSMARNKAGAEALDALSDYRREVRENIRLRGEREQQKSEVEKLKTAPKINTNTSQRNRLGKKYALLDAAIKAPISAALNEAVDKEFTEFMQLVATVKEEAAGFMARKLKVKSELPPFATDPDSADSEQKKKLEDLRTTIDTALLEDAKAPNITDAKLGTAEGALTELKQAHGEISAEILQSKQELTAAFESVPGGDRLGELGREFGAKALQKILPDLGGAKVVGELAQQYSASELNRLITDVGGAKLLGDFLSGACGGSIVALKNFQRDFGSAKAAVDLVQGPLGGKPKILAGLLKGCGGDTARLKSVMDEFGEEDKANLTNLVANGGFAAKKTGTDEDAVPSETLGLFVGSLCAVPEDAGKFKDFCATFKMPKDAEYLKKAMVDGGLGARPQCALQALSKAGKNDPETFRKLAMQLADEDSVASMNILMKDAGGLGERPEVFGNFLETATRRYEGDIRIIFNRLGESGTKNLNGLVKDGGFGAAKTKDDGSLEYEVEPDCLSKGVQMGVCGGDRDKFIEFVQAYSTAEQHADLKKTLVEGGLGQKPQCLAQLTQTGFDGSSMASGKFAGSVTKLQAFSAKLKDAPATHGKLKNLLNVPGGLGDQPEVFGHLIKTGCEENPESAHALLKEFDDDGLTKLNSLVKDGGFAKDTAKGVKPECLGEMLNTGCEKSPAELQKLVKGLDDDDRKNLKGMMTSGSLGKEPKVLGNMYKIGCQKKPADLKTFGAEFKTEADQKKLGNLIDSGGFKGKKGGETDRPETLGEIMHEGFGGPGKNPGSQLKKLNDAFKPNGGTDNTAKLKGIVDSFNFGCKDQNLNGKPGKRVKTLMKHFGDDPAKMKTVFSDKIDRQFDPTTRIASAPQASAIAPSLTKEEMIANAATFEIEAIPPVTAPGSPPRPAGVTRTAMGHFCERHTRKHQTFAPGVMGAKNTTFWPDETTAEQVKALAAATHTKLNADGQGFSLATHGANPWKAVTTTASGYGVKMGCLRVPGPNPPPQTLSNDQFYPTQQTKLTTINSGDLLAIKAALNK